MDFELDQMAECGFVVTGSAPSNLPKPVKTSEFCGFLTNMDDIGKELQKAAEAHEKGFGQLSKGSGNLVGRVEKLRDLGIQSKKELPVSFAQFDKVDSDGDIEQQDELGLMDGESELDQSA